MAEAQRITWTTQMQQFSPLNIQCYGCGRWIVVQQHIASTVQCAACEDCRRRWDTETDMEADTP